MSGVISIVGLVFVLPFSLSFSSSGFFSMLSFWLFVVELVLFVLIPRLLFLSESWTLINLSSDSSIIVGYVGIFKVLVLVNSSISVFNKSISLSNFSFFLFISLVLVCSSVIFDLYLIISLSFSSNLIFSVFNSCSNSRISFCALSKSFWRKIFCFILLFNFVISSFFVLFSDFNLSISLFLISVSFL